MKSIRHASRALLCVLSFGCTAVFDGAAVYAQGVTAQKILIGQSAPTTGGNKDLGNEIRLGAVAAFTMVNKAGGVGGRQIE